MIPAWLYAVPLVLACLFLAAYLITRGRQAAVIGAKIKPMTPDDRLRVSLTARLIEDAERELAQAAWRNNEPGHPAIGELLMDLRELSTRARKHLREH